METTRKDEPPATMSEDREIKPLEIAIFQLERTLNDGYASKVYKDKAKAILDEILRLKGEVTTWKRQHDHIRGVCNTQAEKIEELTARAVKAEKERKAYREFSYHVMVDLGKERNQPCSDKDTYNQIDEEAAKLLEGGEGGK